jgi:type II secretory pathway component PulJ
MFARHRYNKGLTLVEVLISLTLLSLISFSLLTMLSKNNLRSSSVKTRMGLASEVQNLLSDIQKDLSKGAYISNNSYNSRLEYTTYDAGFNASKKIYKIILSSGKYYLQYSSDGGTTWGSPYRMSAYTTYSLNGSPRFLYAGSTNNCTNFSDSNGNGVWTSGVDTAGAYATCTTGTSTSPLTTPSQASKVILDSFEFSGNSGTPENKRTLPTNVFLAVSPGLVRSSTAPASPAVKDPVLVQAFDTATTNSLFGTPFDIRTATWDAVHQHLILVGTHSSGNHTFYLADRKGVMAQQALTTSITTIQAAGAAFMNESNAVLILDATTKKVYKVSLANTSSTITPDSTLDLGSPTNLINTPTGIAFDSSTPTDFYVVGTDPATSTLKIYQRNIASGTLVGTAWSLPAAFTAADPPGGMAIDPITGDFLVVRNKVNSSSINIYRIVRATSASSYFSISTSDLGSSATGTTGNWSLGYDSRLNRLFLSDSATDKVYEAVPNLWLSSS